MAPNFSDNFWGANDPGFNILVERLRRSKHTNEELLEYFNARASIEEEYAKKLQKLAKGVTAKEESGTMKKCIETIREETEKIANIHLKMSSDIKSVLEKPLSTLINEISSKKKNQVKEMERSLKTKRAQFSLVEKTKKNYETKTKEADQAAEALSKATGAPKDIEKLSIKSKKAIASVDAADKEYKNSVEKLDQVTSQWEQDHRTMCDEFQKIEEDRSTKVKEILVTFSEMMITASKEEEEANNKIKENSDNVNPDGDITDFLREFASGSTPPERIVYENISSHLIPVPGGDSNGTLKRPLQSQMSNLSLNENDKQQQQVPEPNNSFLFYVKVLYEYEPQGEEELDLQEGEVIGVVSIEEDPWWQGEKNGKRAMFPSNFVQKL